MRAALAFRAVVVAATLASVVATASCDDDNGELEASRELLERVLGMDYRTWQRPEGWETLRESGAPHGKYTEIFVNDVIVEALASDAPLEAWPVGAIIVKDGWKNEEASDRAILAIMEKRDAGWYWEEYSGAIESDSLPAFAGQAPDPRLCTDCHAGGSDFVHAFTLP